jgi:hypothetical protein
LADQIGERATMALMAGACLVVVGICYAWSRRNLV